MSHEWYLMWFLGVVLLVEAYCIDPQAKPFKSWLKCFNCDSVIELIPRKNEELSDLINSVEQVLSDIYCEISNLDGSRH